MASARGTYSTLFGDTAIKKLNSIKEASSKFAGSATAKREFTEQKRREMFWGSSLSRC